MWLIGFQPNLDIIYYTKLATFIVKVQYVVDSFMLLLKYSHNKKSPTEEYIFKRFFKLNSKCLRYDMLYSISGVLHFQP